MNIEQHPEADSDDANPDSFGGLKKAVDKGYAKFLAKRNMLSGSHTLQYGSHKKRRSVDKNK